MATAAEDQSRRRSDSFGILPPHLSVVLLGNSWKQKVSVGNLILGKTEFTQHKKCVKGSGTFKDTQLTVVNTANVLRPTLTKKKLDRIIQEIKTLSAPGPHVFLLVLQPEYFTEQQKNRLQSVLESFGEQAFNHSLVLISTPLAETPGLMEKYINDPQIRDMIIKCRLGYSWMYYTKYNQNLEELKRKELFTRISELLKENNGENLKHSGKFNTRGQQQVSELMESVETVRVKTKPHSDTTETLVQGQRETISALQETLQDSGAYTTSDGSRDCLRITLIGKTGTGKSSSGNTILGRKEFITKPSPNPVTKVCQKEETSIDGRAVFVVDTPGLFDSTKSDDEVDVERLKCVSLLAPGPHVFLLVFQPSNLRFTEEERKSVELIKKGFGKGVEKFIIILLTHGDQLEASIETFIAEDCNDSFKQLLSECGNRHHVFNNCDIEERSQVKELLKKIDVLVKENEGGCYTNDMLLEAEAAVKKHMERKYEQEIKDLQQVIEKERKQNKSTVQKLQTDLVKMMKQSEYWKERYLGKKRGRKIKSRKQAKEFNLLIRENIECLKLQQQKQEEVEKEERREREQTWANK